MEVFIEYEVSENSGISRPFKRSDSQNAAAIAMSKHARGKGKTEDKKVFILFARGNTLDITFSNLIQ